MIFSCHSYEPPLSLVSSINMMAILWNILLSVITQSFKSYLLNHFYIHCSRYWECSNYLNKNTCPHGVNIPIRHSSLKKSKHSPKTVKFKEGWSTSECLRDMGFQFGVKKSLELDSGDICTTLWMYFIPLNVYFKMIIINSIVFILSHTKRRAGRDTHTYVCIYTYKYVTK